MKKRILSMLIAIVMVVGLVPGFAVPASAATITGQCGDDATYTLTDDGVLTISGTGAIEKNAFSRSAENNATLNKGFKDYLKIQKVIINEGITEIGVQAFYGCSNIASVTLPSTITKIQEKAFFECTNLKNINLPEGLTSIGMEAFYDCNNLTEITIPSTLTSLGSSAFQNCTSLKTVILSEGMTAAIPQYAFWKAILTDITIPASVKKLNQNAFWAASNLKNVTIKNKDITLGNQSFSASDIVFTVPCNFNKTKITATVVNNKNFTFSSDYLHIDANNDGDCDSGCGAKTVASVSLNKNNITLNEVGAIETLTATIMPDSVTADLAWRSDNSAVASVSNGVVTAVGAGTATITVEAGGKTAKCTVTVSLPQNPVTGVSLSQTSLTLAINDTFELDAIIEPENADMKSVTWSSNANDIATVDSDGIVKAVSVGSATITVTTQDGGKTATCVVTVLESHEHNWNSYTGACGTCSLTHFTHGAYEWSEGVCSFCGVTGGYCGYVGRETEVEYILTSTDNGTTYTLTISGYGAMDEYVDYTDSDNPPWYDLRTSITTVEISNGVQDIGWGAFRNHAALQSVSIPSSVTEIKRAAFLGATSLTSITLPGSITKIGPSAFKESGLTSISIPYGVTEIQGSTFSGCTNLTSVTLPNSITAIKGNAFQECISLSQITLPTGLTTVGQWAFNQSGLTSLTIPASVTEIQMHAFSGCPNLKTVTINGTNLNIAERAFQGDEALETLIINNTGIVSIGDYAFMIEVAEDDDDEVDIGSGEIGGWVPGDNEAQNPQTVSNSGSNSIGYYASESEPIERKQDKLYLITLPATVVYTTDYATSFKNRVQSISIEETAKVDIGSSTTLIPVFTPDTAFDNTITWKSSNESVATVDSNGKITGVSTGEVIITATTKYQLNGEYKSASCTVTVQAHTPVADSYVDNGNGTHSYTCSTCGTVTENHTFANGICTGCATLNATLVGSNLTLEGNIGLNFYFELDEAITTNANAIVRFTLENGRVIEIPVSEGVLDTTTVAGKTLYVFTCELNAKQMADIVIAQVIMGENVSAEYPHSIVGYAKTIIANAENKYTDEEIALVKAMLNYGANAQLNFGYNTENLANAELTDAEKSLSAVTAETFESYKVTAKTVDGIGTFAGSDLVLESETTLNVYFKLADGVKIEALTFAVGGKTINPVKSGEYYVISITNITSSELDTVYEISVNDGTASGTFHCSVFAYCYSVLSSDTTDTYTNELKNTLKALYLYNAAANTYFE